jgi:hypothetical protein
MSSWECEVSIGLEREPLSRHRRWPYEYLETTGETVRVFVRC